MNPIGALWRHLKEFSSTFGLAGATTPKYQPEPKPATVTSEDEVKQEYFRYGAMIRNRATLDYLLEVLIWAIGGFDRNTGTAITTHMSVPAKTQAINALAGIHLSENQQSDIKAITRLSEQAIGKANSLVHALGDVSGGSLVAAIKRSARHQIIVKPVPNIGEESLIVFSELNKQIRAIVDFLDSHDDAFVPPTLRKK